MLVVCTDPFRSFQRGRRIYLEIPDNVDEDDEDTLVVFFMQQTQAVALTSQEKATIHIIILPTAIAKHVVCGVVIMLLQRPNLKRLLLI